MLVIKSKNRNRLYYEFIIITILAIISSIILTNIYDSIIEVVIKQKVSDFEIITSYKNNILSDIEDTIEKNIDKIQVKNILNDTLSNEFPVYKANGIGRHRDFTVAIVSSKGELYQSNQPVIIISKENMYLNSQLNDDLEFMFIDNNNKEISALLFYPEEKMTIINRGKNDYIIHHTFNINRDYFCMIYLKNYSSEEFFAFLLGLISFFGILIITIKGRFRYFKTIEEGLSNIYESHYQYKIPIKYRNELTNVAMAINEFSQRLLVSEDRERELLLNISHDLRTPLNTITGYVQLILENKYSSKEELDEYLSHIESKSKYLRSMINDFFEMIRLRWRQYEMNLQTIDMKEFIRQIITSYTPILEKNFILIELELDTNKYLLNCDVYLMQRVFENLLSNVEKYSKPETVCRIKLIGDKKIKISNIPQKPFPQGELPFLFERFSKGDDSRTQEGFGIGLNVVKEIIELHQGEVKAIQEGDEFTVIIDLSYEEV